MNVNNLMNSMKNSRITIRRPRNNEFCASEAIHIEYTNITMKKDSILECISAVSQTAINHQFTRIHISGR